MDENANQKRKSKYDLLLEEVKSFKDSFIKRIELLENRESPEISKELPDLTEFQNKLDGITEFKELIIDQIAAINVNVKKLGKRFNEIEVQLLEFHEVLKDKKTGMPINEYFGTESIDKPFLTGNVLRDESGNEIKPNFKEPVEDGVTVSYKQVP